MFNVGDKVLNNSSTLTDLAPGAKGEIKFYDEITNSYLVKFYEYDEETKKEDLDDLFTFGRILNIPESYLNEVLQFYAEGCFVMAESELEKFSAGE